MQAEALCASQEAVGSCLGSTALVRNLTPSPTYPPLPHLYPNHEDKSMKNLEWLMHGLSLKMKRQFPMVEGNVIHVSGNGFHVNTGAKSGVGVGMKFLLFREIREGDLVLKEPLDTVARVVQVQPETSFAKIISSKGAEKVEKKDLVITK